MIIEQIARRFTALKAGQATLMARGTHLESLAVGQVEPLQYEMARAGRTFQIAYNGTVPTGIAPVQAFPTTAAQWAVFNADASKSYAFKEIGVLLFSGTKGLGGELLACLFQAPAQLQANQATGLVVANASGGSAIASRAVIRSAVTITGPALPSWFVVADDTLAVATVGPGNAIANRNIQGAIIVPPGWGLGLAVLAPAGTSPLYLPLGSWAEIESDLE